MTNEDAEEAAPPAGEEAAQRIWDTIRRIPPGQVSSYGEIAGRAGLPGRARLVGKVLGQVPEGLEVPWFRVLRSDGRIAFPPQSASYREQRARLIGEGVRVEGGRVRLDDFGWGRNLDRELWAPPPAPRAARRGKAGAGAGTAPAKRTKTAARPAAAAGATARTRPVAADAAVAPRKREADQTRKPKAGKLPLQKSANGKPAARKPAAGKPAARKPAPDRRAATRRKS
ncbi:MGMT family protein [Tahibacter harae]|uniref:MGMT family protein n=1 Tax=Tahibacter harae TaxID=2963937 RepID=UPI0031BA4BDD